MKTSSWMSSARRRVALLSLALVLALLAGGAAHGAVSLAVRGARSDVPPAEAKGTVTFAVEGNRVLVESLESVYTYCYIADARLEISPGRVEIHERNAGRLCRAVGTFDIRYAVSRLFPGEYEVSLWREDGELLGSKSLAVGAIAAQAEVTVDPPPPPALSIGAKGDAVFIARSSASVQCCLVFAAEVSLDGNRVIVRERDVSPAPCFCLRAFDLSVEIPGLPPGDWHVEYVDFDGKPLGESDVSIGRPAMVVTQSMHHGDADPPAEPDKIVIGGSGSTVVVEWLATRIQCCLELHASAELLSGDALTFLPIRLEDRGPPCDCLSLFDLRIEVLDLDPGPYRVGLFPFGAEDPSAIAIVELTGSPAETFLRGIISDDWQVDITDAIVVLGHLFLGAPTALGCRDAADTNDDGQVDITDAIYLLSWLFVGGPEPPVPLADLGVDPSPDDLDCASVPCAEEKLIYESQPDAGWDFVEFCIPLGEEYESQVTRLYPEARYLPGSAGCGASEVLVIIEWRDVDRRKLCRLASLGFVREISGSHGD